MAKPQKNTTTPTQELVDVESIQNGIVYLHNGGLRKVLMVSGMNFDLKSEEEQKLILYAYQSFLDSLDFSIQQIVHSRKINVENYLKTLSQYEQQELNEMIRFQISEYREFIRSFVTENPIMTKTFFIVVPFDPTQLSQISKGGIMSFFNRKKTINKEELTAQRGAYAFQLDQRVERVLSGLNHVGLRAVALNDEELTELFYNFYNPEAVEKQGLQITGDQSAMNNF